MSQASPTARCHVPSYFLLLLQLLQVTSHTGGSRRIVIVHRAVLETIRQIGSILSRHDGDGLDNLPNLHHTKDTMNTQGIRGYTLPLEVMQH